MKTCTPELYMPGDEREQLSGLPRAPRRHCLHEDAVWALARPGRGVRIDCLRGSVWITQNGKDVTIRVGQHHVATGVGKIVAQALTPAVIDVSRA